MHFGWQFSLFLMLASLTRMRVPSRYYSPCTCGQIPQRAGQSRAHRRDWLVCFPAVCSAVCAPFLKFYLYPRITQAPGSGAYFGCASLQTDRPAGRRVSGVWSERCRRRSPGWPQQQQQQQGALLSRPNVSRSMSANPTPPVSVQSRPFQASPAQRRTPMADEDPQQPDTGAGSQPGLLPGLQGAETSALQLRIKNSIWWGFTPNCLGMHHAG